MTTREQRRKANRKPVRVYIYRGEIESGRNWLRGYSASSPTGGVYYPWMSKRECWAEARRDGVRARFVEEAP